MSRLENPRSLANLCDWLDANVEVVRDALRALPVAERTAKRDAWTGFAHQLQNAADDDATVSIFRSFVASLVREPNVAAVLPSGFASYLLLVRQLSQSSAVEGRRRFAAVLQVLNESIPDEAEERELDSLRDAGPPDGPPDADQAASSAPGRRP